MDFAVGPPWRADGALLVDAVITRPQRDWSGSAAGTGPDVAEAFRPL